MSDWEFVGKIVVANGKLIPPELPSVPGLYRLTFDDGSLYIGEANDINRRVGDYLIYYPSVGVENEYRINKKLRSSLAGTDVAVLVGEEFNAHSPRCVREHREIKTAGESGKKLLNGGDIKEKIAFHEREIARLREKLAIQQRLDGGM